MQRASRGSQVPLAPLDHRAIEASKDPRASEATWEILDSPARLASLEDLEQLEQLATLGPRDQLEVRANQDRKVTLFV